MHGLALAITGGEQHLKGAGIHVQVRATDRNVILECQAEHQPAFAIAGGPFVKGVHKRQRIQTQAREPHRHKLARFGIDAGERRRAARIARIVVRRWQGFDFLAQVVTHDRCLVVVAAGLHDQFWNHARTRDDQDRIGINFLCGLEAHLQRYELAISGHVGHTVRFRAGIDILAVNGGETQIGGAEFQIFFLRVLHAETQNQQFLGNGWHEFPRADVQAFDRKLRTFEREIEWVSGSNRVRFAKLTGSAHQLCRARQRIRGIARTQGDFNSRAGRFDRHARRDQGA